MKAMRKPGRQRRSRSTMTTKSGKTIKLNRSLSDRLKASKAAKAAKKATYLSTLPKNRWKRLAYRLRPKHLVEYWFSRDGALMALKIIGVAIIACFFLTIGLFAYFRKDLPKIKDISGDNLGGSITYYDRTGQTVLWQDYDAIKRIPVNSDQISPYMKDATVAIEDKNFYKEGAFDLKGIARAGIHDVFGGGGTIQGGSTITEQLVKLNENWTDNRTLTRKVKELILAVELEREYSKDDILTGYLNIAPYGGVEYGVQSAAEDYFQTDAKDLTLPEASMLAAIPQSPSYYSPYSSSQFNQDVTEGTFSSTALLDRQHYILDQMASQHYITQAQADAAKQVNVLALVHPEQSKYQNIKAPYFVLAAKQQLQQTYGASTVQRGGWKVITTLDLNLQTKAEQIVAANLKNVERAGGDEEATVLENVPTGQIDALVGGVDFSNPSYGQNNYAAGILIPPGSSFKPYDYATLINDNNNVGAGSVLYDTETPLPGYPCTNHAEPLQGGNCLEDYDFKQPGPITLRYALGGSRNIPAAKAMLEAVPGAASPGSVITSGDVQSINKTISTASAMIDNTYDEQHHISPYNCYSDAALTQTEQCYTSSAFGDGAYLTLVDHVNGLSTLARLGKAIPSTFILKITDAAGHNVALPTVQPQQVIRPDAAYIVDNMASDPNASYLPGSCTATNCTSLAHGGQKFQHDNGWDFAVKTGTTNNNFDGLMTAWSTQFAVVSWVGNHTRNVALGSTADENLTEPLTRNLMEAAHAGLKPVNWTQPSDIKTEPAFVVRNHIDYGDIEPSPSNDIYPSWYVGGGSSGKTTSQTLDKVSGGVATSCTPSLAKETVSNADVASWNIDIFVNKGMPNINSGSSTSSGSSIDSSASTDSVHNCNDSPPTVTVTAPSNCVNSCTITVTATQGTHPLSGGSYTDDPAGTINVTLGSQTINSQSIPSDAGNVYTYSFTYNPSSSGSGTLTATAVDSVLYSANATANLSYASTSPISAAATAIGSTATVTWTGGGGNFSVSLNGVAQPNCQSSGCTVTPLVHGTNNNTIVVSDSDGDTPSTVTISGP